MIISDLRIRMRALLQRRQVEVDLNDELQFHFQNQVDEFVKQGLSKAEAEHQARQRFGSFDQAKEQCRDERGILLIDELLRDIRFAFRSLLKTPVFLLIAIGTIALGIGVNAAMLSVVKRVVLHPLAIPEADRVVAVTTRSERNIERSPHTSASQFLAWRDGASSFELLAAVTAMRAQIAGPEGAQELHGLRITEPFSSLAGIPCLDGRLFSSADFEAGAPDVVVASERLIREHFQSGNRAIGQLLRIDGKAYQIVGVAGRVAPFPTDGIDFWIPLRFSPAQLTVRSRRDLEVFGRLRPQHTPAQAEAELNGITKQLEVDYPEWLKGRTVQATPVAAALLEEYRDTLIVLSGLALLTLFTCCANVANLLMARGMRRSHEIAVRASLGASRWRLARQLLTESCCLAFVGGILGIAVAWCLLRLADHALADSPFRSLMEPLDWSTGVSVALFSLALSIAIPLLVGIALALETLRSSSAISLRHGPSANPSGHASNSLSGVLIGMELAVSVVLIAGAALLIQSYFKLLHVDRGYAAENILSARIPTPNPRPSLEGRKAFFQDLEQRLGAIPGVTNVGLVTGLPLGGLTASVSLPASADEPVDPGNLRWATVNAVNVDYLRAMGLRLVAERWFEDEDTGSAAKVAVVNETMAREFWPGKDPIGMEIQPGVRIIGIVGDVRQEALHAEQGPAFYALYHQRETLAAAPQFVVLRTSVDPHSLIGSLRRTVSALDRSQPIADIRTMEQVLIRSVAQLRILSALVIGIAAVATVLAMAGVYGTLSYLVGSKVRDIAIRLCLGARARDVLASIAAGLMIPAAGGVLAGMFLSSAASTALSSWLYAVQPGDFTSTLAAAVLASLAAVLGGSIPAIRSLRVDPATTLRSD